MATVYGDTIWGMSAEAGMRAQSFDLDLSIDENTVPDEVGNDVGGALFNEKGMFSLNGFVKSSGFIPSLGAAIVLANAVDGDDFISGDVSGAKTLVTGVKRGKKSREMQSADISGVYRPLFGALQV
jgi:hypothetical protein